MPVEFWREVVDRVAVEGQGTLLLAEAFLLIDVYFVRTLGMHRFYFSSRRRHPSCYRDWSSDVCSSDLDGLPRTTVRYVRELPRGASGRPQELAGDADLAVSFVASAHDRAGRPSFSGPSRARPLWPALREYALVSEAGGRVVFGIGVDRRLSFRVIELGGPARVVVDVAN